MIIVLIHWRIKPDGASEAQFLDFWKNEATISNKLNLVGEFLSRPLPASSFGFKVDDLSTGHSQGDCRHFINVGLWADWESFEREVGRLFDDSRALKPFEAERRTRTILQPEAWRRGDFQLPSSGSVE